MNPTEPDDPTRALDDFVRRMRQPHAARTDALDLSDLGARLQPGTRPGNTPGNSPGNSTRPGAKGGVLRSGQRWLADDVQDVPVVDLPRPPISDTRAPEVSLPSVDMAAEQAQAALSPDIELPAVAAPPLPNDEALQNATRSARDLAASSRDSQAQQAGAPVWQPDATALQLRPASHPRVLSRWAPGAWVGAVKLVFSSATEFVNTANGPAVETHAPQRLLLLWAPQGDAGPLGRWPQLAQLIAVPAAQVAQAALALLADDALLWLQPDAASNAGAVDWALGADIVLHHTAALRPFQTDALRAFIDTERQASFKRLNDGYQQAAPGAAVLRR